MSPSSSEKKLKVKSLPFSLANNRNINKQTNNNSPLVSRKLCFLPRPFHVSSLSAFLSNWKLKNIWGQVIAEKSSAFPSLLPTKASIYRRAPEPLGIQGMPKKMREGAAWKNQSVCQRPEWPEGCRQPGQLADSRILRQQWGVVATALIQWQRFKSCVTLGLSPNFSELPFS